MNKKPGETKFFVSYKYRPNAFAVAEIWASSKEDAKKKFKVQFGNKEITDIDKD